MTKYPIILLSLLLVCLFASTDYRATADTCPVGTPPGTNCSNVVDVPIIINPIGSGNNPLLPLITNASLATPNSSTLTFPGSQNWQGFNVYSNGNRVWSTGNGNQISAVAVYLNANGNAIFKQNQSGGFPASLPQSVCLADSLTATNTLTAPSGTFTDPSGAAWTWGGSNSDGDGSGFLVNRNTGSGPVNVSIGADRYLTRLYLGSDGNVYGDKSILSGAKFKQFAFTGAAFEFGGYRSPFTNISGGIPVGTFRRIAVCPSVLDSY